MLRFAIQRSLTVHAHLSSLLLILICDAAVKWLQYMFSYSYNLPSASMSRLDELLNRNQLIYQNLKQKLDGINRSNQNIYRNISHIQTSFSHDPFSQESSAIQREPTIKNTSVRTEQDDTAPKLRHLPLQSIDEHQEVTFSQDNNLEIQEEARTRRIIEEEQRLYELELMLERERQLQEEKLMQLEVARREREQMQRMAHREERERQSVRERMSRPQERKQQEKPNHEDTKRESVTSGQLSDRLKGRLQRQPLKNGIKNNSIYLSKIPKTSLILDTEDEIPTFRESFAKKREPESEAEEEKEKIQNNHQLKTKQPESPLHQPQLSETSRKEDEAITSSHRGQQLRELPTLRSNRLPQQKQKPQIKKQPIILTNDHEAQNYPNLLDNSSIIPDTHDPDPFEYTIARSQPRKESLTPYSELNSHFKNKLEEIELVPECLLFAPFNKVYRSPILQLKPGCLTLERKSKTSSITSSDSRTRIVDGLRYKFKTVITDEQLLLKRLFCSEDTLNFEKRQCNKIAIVGGREALKKKLHMGLLAYCHQQLALEIGRTHKNMMIQLEHQCITPNEEPFVLESTIDADPTTRRLALMKLQKMTNDILDTIKKLYCVRGTGKKVLRMTKITMTCEGEGWSCSIISSNRYDYDFLRHLRVNKICWSINPLVKFYDQVRETLQSMRYYISNRRTA